MEDKRIEAFELRKNREQNKKFNKQVSDLKKQEKSKTKKTEIKEISKLRKSSASGDEKEQRLESILKGEPGGKSKKRLNMVR